MTTSPLPTSTVERPLPGSGQAPGAAAGRGRAAPTPYTRLVRAADTAVALLALLGAFVVANLDRMPGGLAAFLELRFTVKNFLLLVGFTVAWRAVLHRLGLYDRVVFRDRRRETVRVLGAAALGTVVALIFPVISKTGAFSVQAVLYFGGATAGGMLLARWVLRSLVQTSAPSVRHVIIVGSGRRALTVYEELAGNPCENCRILGFVDGDAQLVAPELRDRFLGRLPELEALLMRRAVDEVVIALPIRSHYAEIQQAIEVCSRGGVPATYLADAFESPRGAVRFSGGERQALATVGAPPDGTRLLAKRVIDVLGGTLALLLSLPVLLAAAIAIKATSRGPIVFSQERYGQNKRRFRMHKFRTMVVDAEGRQSTLDALNETGGPAFKVRRDPRITAVGRFLRRTSIDELPQLWNVIRGEMSLVGPRPLPLRDVDRFSDPALMRRFSVRPGMSGLWQINGRSTVTFDEWVRLDLQYVDQWSLMLDLRILLQTLPAVVRGTGAY